jgi:hypothetical protein
MGNGCASLSADFNPISGQTNITGSINGWTIGPKGEDARVNNELENIYAVACTAAAGCTGANGLDIQFTDSNFGPSTAEFSISYGDTESGIGTTSESAYFDDANRPFAGGPGSQELVFVLRYSKILLGWIYQLTFQL